MTANRGLNKLPVKPQAARGEIILYLKGGYVIKIAKEFTLPIGSHVDLELSQAETVVKDDWYFNNEEVLETRVDEDGKKVAIAALSIGVSKCLIRSINLELTINVTGGEAVGFDVERDASSDEFEG